MDFGASGPSGSAFVGDVVHQAAVAGGGNVVFELQFKPVVLFGGDQVAGIFWVVAFQGAFFDNPAGADGFAFEVAPAVEAFAVKEQFPACAFFGGGQPILRLGGGRSGAKESG